MILPTWDNSTEYQGVGTADFNKDLSRISELVRHIAGLNLELASFFSEVESPIRTAVAVPAAEPAAVVIPGLQKISEYSEEAMILLSNLGSFIHCELALDAKNSAALKMQSQIEKLHSEFETASLPSELFLTRASDELVTAYLRDPRTQAQSFVLREKRKMRDLMLSTAEESVLAQFKQYGPLAWGNLYTQISGSLKVTLPSAKEKVMGLSEASGLVKGADENLRKEAWQGIQAAWKTYEEPCAAVLNGLTGYRLEEYKKRSHTRKIDFLEFPLMQSKIQRQTLEAMMSALSSQVEVSRRAMRVMAKAMGKSKIDPWDIVAPAPASKTGDSRNATFAEGLALIEQAFSTMDPAMGDFVKMMNEKNWIDGRVLPNKASGAFCTGFAKSRTPRVFQTYLGSESDISTLAHELGHAYHSWVMRDLPWAQLHYPMTLAETASIFAENLLADHFHSHGTVEQKRNAAWADAGDAIGLLVNIPARFDFEKSLFEARELGSLTPAELSDLTDKAWRKWYGDEISETEKQFWMTKAHFSISEISFYNYPYTFGYLFSLGIYAKRQELGSAFSKVYVDLLRDTGRMTAEELIQKHLGQDIRQPEFWLQSLRLVEKKVAVFENLWREAKAP